MFIDNPTDEESKTLAEWGQANDVLQYDVSMNHQTWW